MKIIIYATHSFGTFETLKQHPDVVVLGYGTKWNGFIEKVKVIKEYINTLPKEEVVCIIDGFDSYILKTDGLLDEFLKMDCKVLVSKDEELATKYFTRKVFTTCKEDRVANAGLLMGYVEYLTILYDKIIHGKSHDDQRNLNIACKELPFLKVDNDHTIFQNCNTMNNINNSTAYICQRPFTLSFSRLFSSISQYFSYFIIEFILMFSIILGYIYRNKITKYAKRLFYKR
jgi:hypothetical protein